MNNSSKTDRIGLNETQQMQRWVRRYAQNRSLPVVVFLVLFAMLSVTIGAASYFGGLAYRDGHTSLFATCLVVLILSLAATVFFSVPGWGGRLLQQASEKLYAREGRVTIGACADKPRWWSAALAAAFVTCVTGSVILGVLGYLPGGKWMQPISAIYVVPFLVALNFLIRPTTGYIPLLWPLLYGLHALLIMAGAPIVFTGPWEGLNILIPIVGYGILVGFVGHLYSRWALHNVRTIVSHQLDRAEPVDGDN
jgi:hypothetical protein